MELEDIVDRDDIPADVREVLRREVALRDRERRAGDDAPDWRGTAMALMKCFPGQSFVKDRQSRFVAANDHVLEGLGTTMEALRGKTDFDLFPHSEAQKAFAEEQEVLRTGEPLRASEYTYIGDDGRRYWHVSYKFPIYGPRGDIVGLAGFNHETTALQRAEKALLLQRDLGSRLAATGDLDEALNHVLEAAAQLEHVHVGGVYLAADDGSPTLAAQFGMPHGCPDLACHEEPKSVLHDGPGSCGDGGPEAPGMCGFDCIALRHGEEVLGGLVLGSHTMERFPEDVRAAAEAIASQLAGALIRLQSARRLGESEQRLRSVSDAVPDAIVMLDAHGKVTHWNAAAERIFQYSAQEVLGRDLHALVLDAPTAVGGGPRPEGFRGLGEGFDSGRVVETVARRKDGSYVPVELSVAGLRMEGSPHTVGVVRDISERRQTEERLRLHSMVLDQIHDRVTVTDLGGVITYVNDAECHMLGRSRDELIGQSVRTFGDDPSRGASQEYIIATTLADGSWRGEVVNYTSDGAELVLDSRTHLVRDAGGEPVAMCGIATDITERKMAEEALREREARLRSILRAAPVGIGMVVNRVIKEVNDAVCRLTGYDRDELIGRDARVLYPTQEEYEAVGRDKYAQLRERLIGSVETRWQRKDGQVLDVLLSSSPIDPGDWAHGVTFTVMDLSERKRAEETQRMATVGQLAAGVAHEFNNILAGMMLRAEQAMLCRRSEDLDALCDLVLRSSSRGAEICSNLTAFARPRAPKRECIKIEEALENALSLVDRQLQQSGVAVVRDYGPAHRVLADQGQLEQVFINLFVNACHAMPGGGTLSVRTSPEEGADGEPQVLVTVSDTGVGIPTENRARIFEPFFTTKGRLGESDVPGTGLGLSVSLGIIKAHGGSLSVAGEPGEGATLEIRLAACETEATDRGKADGVSPQQATGGPLRDRVAEERVLIAEDEDDVREMLHEALSAAGYSVVSVRDGTEALQALAAGQFHAVITDLLMAGAGGQEVVAAAARQAQAPPVVVITGRIDDRTAQGLAAEGAAAVIHKPFRLRQVLEALEAVLAGRARPEAE